MTAFHQPHWIISAFIRLRTCVSVYASVYASVCLRAFLHVCYANCLTEAFSRTCDCYVDRHSSHWQPCHRQRATDRQTQTQTYTETYRPYAWRRLTILCLWNVVGLLDMRSWLSLAGFRCPIIEVMFWVWLSICLCVSVSICACICAPLSVRHSLPSCSLLIVFESHYHTSLATDSK